MRERPIIFNADMVRAVLDGRKTQTRRIVNGVPSSHDFHGWVLSSTSTKDEGKACWAIGKSPLLNQPIRVRCPFGEVGDRLWVKETWSVVSHAFDDDGLMIDYVPDRPAKAVHEKPFGRGYYSGHAIYAADGGFTWGDDDGCVDGRSCWKPSIHMPRWASRITLEITGVRVERLNSINEHDAIAEGLAEISKDGRTYKYGVPDRDGYPGTDDFGWPWHEWERYPISAYSKLWKSIYGDESWQANPWVWVIEFKRVEVE
ncbi:hypothetical protein [Pantoea agglomerans]|uniref:hypothetical protein n=1 Tax=Enterobacter agglomerans TaxID=549 RepID=UPI0010095DA6|nr:hypothetical protein [Pantoea agglomerans]QAV46700.1 hypothetical protein D1629_12640 [Pantoea agglomerans]QAV51371.1 hypothetical protein D1628_13650 [Pantoea agglomerans]